MVSAMSLLSIHEPAMYKSPSSSSVSPVTPDTATVRLDLSRLVIKLQVSTCSTLDNLIMLQEKAEKSQISC